MHSHATWKPWTLTRGVARNAKAAASTNEQESLTSTRASQSRGSIRGVARTKPQPYKRLAIVNVQAQAKAEQPISSQTLAYGLEQQRIPPGRPSMNAAVEGRERQTRRKQKPWSKETHALSGGSESSARQAVAARSTKTARAPHDPHTQTSSHFKEEGRCGVVTTRIIYLKIIIYFKLN